MKKLLIGLTLLTSISAFAEVRLSCEPRAGVSMIGSTDMGRLQKGLCNKRASSIDNCNADIRCVAVNVQKTKICKTQTVAEDAQSGYEVIYNQDGTVSTY